MIKSFGDKDTEAFFAGERVRRFEGCADQARRRLRILDAAERIEDLIGLRSNRFEALGGDRSGQFSICVNRQWRLCFRFENGGAYGVAMADYH